ncbi:MAG: 4Fe-4S binding protein [Phycisphaerae bacterium]|nr:4Fe-4S binding protein [Phycisphaerae bacterium]
MNRRKALQSLLKLIVLHVFVLSSFAVSTVIGQFILRLGQFFIPTLSPHVAVVGAVTVRAVGLAAILGLPMLVIVTLRRRWFCRWLCPVGLIVDSCAKVRPGAKYGYRKIPPVGQWLMLATLGGAIVGWPLFLWLDPLSIFAASLNASRWPLDAPAIGSLSIMAAIVVMSLIFPKLWCLKLCPLGGMQEMLFGVKLLATRKKSEVPSSLSGVTLARRSALFTGLGVAGGFVIARFDRKRNQPQLRPPGAVDDTKFKGLCARCGNCVKVCPTGIIRQDLRPSDPAGLLTPIVHFKKGVEKIDDYDKYCKEHCRACTQACPTGAIASLSLKDKLCRPIGLAEVDMTGCILKLGVQCSICVFDICPQDAIKTNDINAFDVEIVIDRDKCNGCGACVVICPEKVIEVRPNGRYTIDPVDTGSV